MTRKFYDLIVFTYLLSLNNYLVQRFFEAIRRKNDGYKWDNDAIFRMVH